MGHGAPEDLAYLPLVGTLNADSVLALNPMPVPHNAPVTADKTTKKRKKSCGSDDTSGDQAGAGNGTAATKAQPLAAPPKKRIVVTLKIKQDPNTKASLSSV